MTVSFDEQWNADDDPYAVILSPAAPERAYERRQPTIDDLLDLRHTLTMMRDSYHDSDPTNRGLDLAVKSIDNLLASL